MGVLCVDRDARGRFVSGHEVLAARNNTTGKFISWKKVSEDIDKIIEGVNSD